ncbi:hypothetical protein P8452_56532 [Trifolium repens]|nr:hypothetical protein P8452_09592 [Trifolium repens]WJX61302.1 hypothetical protein P8452_46408 [Trifolium repens]WJX72681.1 hypothetical protein P8452_56532 [Trifolium repens]
MVTYARSLFTWPTHILLVLSTEVARLKAIAKDAVLLRCKVIAELYDCGGPILLEVFQIGTGGLNGMGYIVMTCRNLSRISILNFREQRHYAIDNVTGKLCNEFSFGRLRFPLLVFNFTNK